MSVSNEVTRILAARNAIRNALLAWGVAQADDAIDELGDDYSEEEIRLVRIKFISEMGN